MTLKKCKCGKDYYTTTSPMRKCSKCRIKAKKCVCGTRIYNKRNKCYKCLREYALTTKYMAYARSKERGQLLRLDETLNRRRQTKWV